MASLCLNSNFSPALLKGSLPIKEIDLLDGLSGPGRHQMISRLKFLIRDHHVKRVVIRGEPWIIDAEASP